MTNEQVSLKQAVMVQDRIRQRATMIAEALNASGEVGPPIGEGVYALLLVAARVVVMTGSSATESAFADYARYVHKLACAERDEGQLLACVAAALPPIGNAQA